VLGVVGTGESPANSFCGATLLRRDGFMPHRREALSLMAVQAAFIASQSGRGVRSTIKMKLRGVAGSKKRGSARGQYLCVLSRLPCEKRELLVLAPVSLAP
jgi:hypothetical protein